MSLRTRLRMTQIGGGGGILALTWRTPGREHTIRRGGVLCSWCSVTEVPWLVRSIIMDRLATVRHGGRQNRTSERGTSNPLIKDCQSTGKGVTSPDTRTPSANMSQCKQIGVSHVVLDLRTGKTIENNPKGVCQCLRGSGFE